ncbi:hypothetical protein LCGC14_1225270 [marine sediment metagenome]|uniref:Leucine-rich repeat domain-containing protein n=1 Tax=marine sediment metagenome TaxID=412755 RepID=A0A0F9NSI2_9ZZZZ
MIHFFLYENINNFQFCSKCGEPLPKLEKLNVLEKLIDKLLPLTEEFSRSSTCYAKEGEEVTGVSIFKCGLKAFPLEILRLKILKNLALRRYDIEHLPKEIGFLSNLEYLDLRLNNIEILPSAIGLLLKLKNLILARTI